MDGGKVPFASTSLVGSVISGAREMNLRFVSIPGGHTMIAMTTPYGTVHADPTSLELGELLVSDDGVELEVVAVDPVRFEPAPQEAEDWGE